MADDRDRQPKTPDEADGQETAAEPTAPPATEPAFAAATPGDDIGTYLLDALPDEERAAFAAFLATSPEAQVEVRHLAPVVALLPKLFDFDIPAATTVAPAADLRDRIIAAAEAERPAPAAAPAPDAAEPIPLATTIRPQGRIRGGVATAPGTPAPTPIQSLSSLSRLPISWLSAAALAVVAAGAVIWALALQGRIDDKNREITAQSTEVAELRQNANATAFTLSAATEAAGSASGTIFYSLKQQIGILYVNNLPPLAEDRDYQIWYISGDDPPIPGGTFDVDDQGNGVLVVDPQTPTYDGVALTEEPDGGSDAPTTDVLLQGALAGAAG